MRPILTVLLIAVALSIAVGCSSTPTRTDGSTDGPLTAEGGEGYLAEGPTVHLRDTENDRYSSPLVALERRGKELEEARQSIEALEDRVLELEEEKRDLGRKNADLHSRLEEAVERVADGRRGQQEMAEALARLRIRTVRLETELLNLKLEVLAADAEVPETPESTTPPSTEDPEADPAEDRQ